MRDRLIFTGQLLFTLLVAAFLIVPAILSISAGVTVNYFRGISSGVTLQWVFQVWELYAGTILLSFVIAFATAMGAFGTAFTLATNIDVLPMLIYTEFTLAANFSISAALSVGLGFIAWAILAVARSFSGGTVAAAG